MSIGTWDLIYHVELKNGEIVEMTSWQYNNYKIILKVFKALYVLFYPIRKVRQWQKI